MPNTDTEPTNEECRLDAEMELMLDIENHLKVFEEREPGLSLRTVQTIKEYLHKYLQDWMSPK